MNNGANKDYDFSHKNHWRRWAWNQIKSRISVKPSEAIVLYLAGKENLDLEIALSKKFKKENLIAIERDKNTISFLRKNKVNVVSGDFNDVLLGWGEQPKIDVIIADFCGDIYLSNDKSNSLLRAIFYCKGVKDFKTVFVANFQRGRSVYGGFLSKITGEKNRGINFDW